jgi:GntR family transcriptional regulator
MNLNRQSPLPLYRQLADILKSKIEAGEYSPGEKIPSEPELAKAYGLGRPTIRQALGMLVHEGRLSKRHGSGTFVREKQPDIDLFSLAGTSAAFLDKGLTVTQRLLKKISLVMAPAVDGNPFAGRQAFFFSRLSLYRTEPILIEETWLDPALFAGIERFDFSKVSLSRVVSDRYYLKPVFCRQTFRATGDRTRAALFGLKKPLPLLEVARTLNFPDHPAGIFSLIFCRTDQFTFSQTLAGGIDGA